MVEVTKDWHFGLADRRGGHRDNKVTASLTDVGALLLTIAGIAVWYAVGIMASR